MSKVLAKEIKKQDKIKIKAAVSSLNDLTIQKKAFMSLVASNALSKYLREQKITIISENNGFSGLLLLKEFDIANIAVENNKKIAVRTFVGNDYPQMCIPRSHFSNDILADIYVAVRLESKFEEAEFVGYIEASQIDRQKGNNKYVSIDAEQLKPIENLKQAINSSGKRKNSYFALDHEKARELFFKYSENRISSSDKEFFVRHFASCNECSQEFNQIIELDNIIKASSNKFNFEEENINNQCIAENMLVESASLDELFENAESADNKFISAEIDFSLNNDFDCTDKLNSDFEEDLIFSEENPESVFLYPDKDAEEEALQSNFHDIMIDPSDIFDFNPEDVIKNTALFQDVKLNNISNLTNELYENQESVPKEYLGLKFNSDSEEEQQEKYFDEYEYEYEYDDKPISKYRTKEEKKFVSNIAIAGIAATIAIALWVSNKSIMNKNLPVSRSQAANQTAFTDNQDSNLNNTESPLNMPENQQIDRQSRLSSYKKQSVPLRKDLNAVLAEAFTRTTYEVDIRNISWEVTADMAQNPIFKNYIMVTGQALKSALARDLSVADERALNTQMEIKTVLDLNGNVLQAIIAQSSGSKEVDRICLETYKTTIQFTKLPKINVNRDKIKANLIISF